MLIVNTILILSAYYPPVQEWVKAHSVETMQLVCAANWLLRLVTKGKISLQD